jgi:protein TonB
MSTVAVSPDTRKVDVLTITLFLAALAHALLILGLGFQPFLQEMRTPPALEVILVQQTTDSEAPEEADYLAQSAQDGGGQSDDNARPASPFASQQDLDTDGLAATPVLASSPEPAKPGAEPILTTVFSQDDVKTDDSEQETTKDIARKDTILIEENLDIARLAAEIERQQEEFAKRPKKKWLNARTHEATSAEYMYRWVEKVERIGNLNYPDEVRRKKLTGALMLSVGIYKNGDIESITVEESSGHRLLDDSARRIVELSGPFAPLTGSLAEETDILYIVRTWEFNSSNSVISY